MEKTINIEKAINELKNRGINFVHYSTENHNCIEIDNLSVSIHNGDVKWNKKTIGNLKEMPPFILEKIMHKIPDTDIQEYENISVVFNNVPLIHIFLDGALLPDDSIDESKVIQIKW